MLGGRKSEDLPLPSEKKFPKNISVIKKEYDSDDSIQPRGMGS